MDFLNHLVSEINSVLWGVFCLIPLLCGTGIFYSIKLRFVQVLKFGLATRLLFGGATLFGKRADKTGMSSFQALATAGAPDSVALSTGISEALVNTAFGIATGALAVISYNYFSNKIDNVTYAIDEVGFCIVNTFAATHK